LRKSAFEPARIRQRALPILCVDFDGTLVDFSQGYRGPGVYGAIIEGAREAVRRLAMRFRVVVLTARDVSEHEGILAYLQAHGVEVAEVTNVKPPAAFYVDDRAVRFTEWPSVLVEVEGRQRAFGVPSDAGGGSRPE